METGSQDFAVALGGLGGFNAHDAGVLAALLDHGLRPRAITCTSGAIYWVYRYLLQEKDALDKGKPVDLAKEVAAVVAGFKPDRFLQTMMFGTDFFRPATFENLMNLPTATLKLAGEMLMLATRAAGHPDSSASILGAMTAGTLDLFDVIAPARVLISNMDDEEFAAIVGTFRACDIPLFFNSFDLATGDEVVYFNPAARSLVPAAGRRSMGSDNLRAYREIAGIDDIKSALWLTQYGFSGAQGPHASAAIDGAYRRSIMIGELCSFATIYAVKPQPDAWSAKPPGNQLELLDFNIEMWFNASYASEVAGVRMINDLKDQGLLNAAGLQHFATRIEIVPITLRKPLGIFNFVSERISVFDDARHAAGAVFGRAQTRSVQSAGTPAGSAPPITLPPAGTAAGARRKRTNGPVGSKPPSGAIGKD